MTKGNELPPQNQQPEDLLSPEACWAIKERFGSMWRQAWVAWQLPTGTWMVTQIKHLTADMGLPENSRNSSDMFCFRKLGKPTEQEMLAMMSRESTREPPTVNEEQVEKLLKTFPGAKLHKMKVKP